MRIMRIPLTMLFLCLALFAQAEIVPLTILHTNDFHSYLTPGPKGQGGAAVIAGYLKQTRRDVKNLLILDAGDMVAGTPVSTLFKGLPVYRVTNRWGIDASILGNHEFDYGWTRIEEYRRIAEFPLLCANAYVMGHDGQLHLLGDAPYQIFERGGLKIGVIGVVAEWTPSMTVKEGTQGVTFVKSGEALQRLVPELSTQVDLVIVLSHVGLKHDQWLANGIRGMDLIVGGHSHTAMYEHDTIRGTYIVQAGSKGNFVGRIDLKADTEKDEITDFAYRLIPVNKDMALPDSDTEAEVKKWEDQVAELVDRPLAVAEETLDQREMVDIAEAAFLESTGADYAHQNNGGTRGSIDKGSFPYRTVWNTFPFDNTLVVAKVKGDRIPEGFDGLQPIDPSRTYRIVTNSFVRDQWERDFPKLKGLQWEDTGVPLRDSVIQYMEKHMNIRPVKLTR